MVGGGASTPSSIFRLTRAIRIPRTFTTATCLVELPRRSIRTLVGFSSRILRTLASYVPDLLKDRILTRISDLYPLWVALSLAVPALLGGLITHSWMGALPGLIWGGIIRVAHGSSHYLEREFDLPSMGKPAIPDPRSESK